ncbi:MAG: hypothetical protein JXL97_05730 [Bacteroidales bacterium]|nr:hypothetical protein [Bacteroidales bacterium]
MKLKKTTNPQCPVDGHYDSIIPIVYGLPSPKLMKQAERGKVKLGGCMVYNDNPQWYCKKHDVAF